MVALAVLALVVGSQLTPGVAETRLGRHVVGGDRGWDVASDVAGWSTDKEFRVGESISSWSWGARRSSTTATSATHQAVHRRLNKVALEEEGPRFFTSGRPESCSGGLKLHVNVRPQPEAREKPTAQEATVKDDDDAALAPGPASGAAGRGGIWWRMAVWMATIFCFVGVLSA
ncbi:unnamed protein product [Spirodela intermedia]|uniref:Uncharacterized protein n=1 Tax=Spirodela intermedia TaxID=51605 RepID=A0A7I8JL03_SPIIN|nr:unnamed protein product [Spirodela intermedia]CAA6670818.1 unnamed protein product [Spirodela intermedia]